MDTSKSFYLELEQKLFTLRTHFAICKDLKNDDVLEWAKFFEKWSREATAKCGVWTLENLKNAENFVKNLEKTKVGIVGYEVLERLMGEAALRLNREILDAVKRLEGQKEPLPVR